MASLRESSVRFVNYRSGRSRGEREEGRGFASGHGEEKEGDGAGTGEGGGGEERVEELRRSVDSTETSWIRMSLDDGVYAASQSWRGLRDGKIVELLVVEGRGGKRPVLS